MECYWCFGQLWLYFTEIKWIMFTIGNVCRHYEPIYWSTLSEHNRWLSVKTWTINSCFIGWQLVKCRFSNKANSQSNVHRVSVKYQSILINRNTTGTRIGWQINNKRLVPNWHLNNKLTLSQLSSLRALFPAVMVPNKIDKIKFIHGHKKSLEIKPVYMIGSTVY